MPRKTTATKAAPTKKPAPRKPAAPKAAPVPSPTAGFIDTALMERAIALRGEGKTMKQIGAELSVKATGYLAKKIKTTYGADALDVLAKPATTKEA